MNTVTMADRVDAYLSYRRALGYQLRSEGQMLSLVRPLCRRLRSLRSVDDGTRPSLGPPTGAGRPSVSSAPAGSGADPGPVSGPARARHRGPASWAARPGPRPPTGIHLHRGRHRRTDRCGSGAGANWQPASPNLRRLDRVAGLHRTAYRRSPRAPGRATPTWTLAS